jgi:hypothetical protein
VIQQVAQRKMETQKRTALLWTGAALIAWSVTIVVQRLLHQPSILSNMTTVGFWTSFVIYVPAFVASLVVTIIALRKWKPVVKQLQRNKRQKRNP